MKKAYENKKMPPPGVNNFLHILSMFITGVNAVSLFVLSDALLFNKIKSSSILSDGLYNLYGSKAVSAYMSSAPALICTGILIVLLLCANAVIYAHVVKKIFEHFSIAFTGAGALTLLVIPGLSTKAPHFICAGVFILIGAALMLVYGIFYHRETGKSKK